MLRRTDNLMVLLHLWNSILFLLTTVGTTGSTVSETEKDIMHAIEGNSFIIRTLSMIGSTLFITIKKDNNTILDLSMGVDIATNSTVQNGRLMLVYNQTVQELCLLFENISKEDGGIYEIKEIFDTTNTIFNTTNTISNKTEADTYVRNNGTWNLEIYVLGPGETKQGEVGANISMEFEFENSRTQSILYNYDEHRALVVGSTCSILTDSYLYGRLRCTTDDSGRKYNITIVNISQRDSGLYKVAIGRNETGRCFISIKDSPTCTVVGGNMTIGWYYNQQGIKRTLRVIHPNEGVMMLLTQSNSPQIKSNFQPRLLYRGDTLQSFMSFTLLNVRWSDAGLYIIETLHGNTIPGSKELNVEGTCTTGGGMQNTLHDVTTKISDTKQEIVPVQPMERQCVPIAVVIPVVTVAVVVSIAIIAMTGWLIWIQRRNKLEADKRLVVEKCEAISLATPSIIRRPLNRSPMEEGWVSRLTLSNDLFHHPYPAIPLESGVINSTGYSTVLLSDVEAGNQGISCIADHNGLSKMADGAILIACVKHSDDEQRLVLEQCETSSCVTSATIRRPPYMPPCEDTWTHGEVPERKAFSNAKFSLPFTAISNVSASLDNAWCSTDSLSEHDDYKASVYCITNPNYTVGRTDEKSLVSCDRNAYNGVLDSCAPTCTLGSAAGCEEHIYKCILNINSSSQVSQSIQSLYTQIKKGPNIASRNTTTIDNCAVMGGNDSPLCGAEHEMVNISTDFDQDHTLQDDSVGYESAKGQIPLCNG